MIMLTKFQGREFYINSDLIETIEETPDTMITLITGKKMTVQESPEEVLERILNFRKHIAGTPRVICKE
jgi:flagellar protein FlbD